MFKINIIKSLYDYLKNSFLIIFFLSFITIIPIIGFIQKPMEGYWYVEPITTKIIFKDLTLNNTSTHFSNYFNSIFGFRKFFINIKNYIIYIFQINSKLVIIGKDHFLYYLSNFFIPVFNLPTENLNKMRKAYPKNIPIIFINIPHKAEVDSNNIPNYVIKQHSKSQETKPTQTLLNGIYFLNLTPYLQNYAKQNPNDPLYYKTDDHWNSYASYLSYKKIIEFLNQTLNYNFQIPPLKNTQIIHTTNSLNFSCYIIGYVYTDKLKNLCIKNGQSLHKEVNILYKEGSISQKIKFNCVNDYGISSNVDCGIVSFLVTNSSIKKGTILIIGASFSYLNGVGLYNFLIHNFKNIYFINSEQNTNNKDIYKNIVKQIKPDMIFLIHYNVS